MGILVDPPDCTLACLRIASSADIGGENPYISLFYRALEAYGIRYVGRFEANSRWLPARARDLDVLHFHWPEHLLTRCPSWMDWLNARPGGWRLQRRLMPWIIQANASHLAAFLEKAKSLGKRIIWTVHNLAPHEWKSDVQERTFHLLASSSDLLICHDEHARAEVLSRYQVAGDVVVMPLGTYSGVYPAPRSASAVRRELGLTVHKPLLGCLGTIRQNKGFDLASDAVRLLGNDFQLLVAGKPTREDAYGLFKAAAECKNIHLIARFLSAQEFADFSHACDVVLLPYHSVTGSSALLAAFAFGRGVVASDLPYFRSVLSQQGDAGCLFSPGDAKSLAAAISCYLRVPEDQRRNAAEQLAQTFSWSEVIKPVAEILLRW